MPFYILLIIIVVLFVWWLTRTNLYRHRSRHSPDPSGPQVGSAWLRATDDFNRLRRNPSGLRKRPPDRPN
jgi:hypothetical protein